MSFLKKTAPSSSEKIIPFMDYAREKYICRVFKSIHLCIHSFNRFYLSTYCVSGSAVSPGGRKGNENGRDSVCPQGTALQKARLGHKHVSNE